MQGQGGRALLDKPAMGPGLSFELVKPSFLLTGYRKINSTFTQNAATLVLRSGYPSCSRRGAMKSTLSPRYTNQSDCWRIQLRGVVVAAISTIAMVAPALSAPPNVIYWTDATQQTINRAGLDGASQTNIINSGLSFPEGIAVDEANNKMYWVDVGLNSIKRANLYGAGIEDLVTTGLSSPEDIELDVAHGKMYWVDGDTNRVQRANLNGTGVETLVSGLNLPVGIALDLIHEKVYFSNRNSGNIQRANLDGTGLQTIVSGLNSLVFDVDLDVNAGKMYWCTSSETVAQIRIQRANLDGSSLETIYNSNSGLVVSLALDTTSGFVYSADPILDKIRRSNLDGTNVTDIVTSGLTNPQFLALAYVPEPNSIFLLFIGAGLLRDVRLRRS